MSYGKVIALVAVLVAMFAFSASSASAASSCGQKTLNGLPFNVEVSSAKKITCNAATKVLNQFEKDTKSPTDWACVQTVQPTNNADGSQGEQRFATCKPSARVLKRYKQEKNKLLGVILKATQVVTS